MKGFQLIVKCLLATYHQDVGKDSAEVKQDHKLP